VQCPDLSQHRMVPGERLRGLHFDRCTEPEESLRREVRWSPSARVARVRLPPACVSVASMSRRLNSLVGTRGNAQVPAKSRVVPAGL